MASPADAVRKIANELKQKAADAGMGKVETFVTKLEEITEMAKKGPDQILKAMMGAFESFKKVLDDAMANPASLAPGGGAMVSCATWYGSAVVNKLKSFADEVTKLFEMLKDLAGNVTKPMGDLKDGMESAMSGLENSANKLAKLPTMLTQMAGTLQSPDDVSKIDTDSMKKATDLRGIDGPLSKLNDLKGTLLGDGGPISALKRCVQSLEDFITSAPNKIKSAFQVPTPLCFLHSVLMSQAPPMMTKLLDNLELLKRVDLSSLVAMLTNVGDALGGMDIDMVKKPLITFADSAKGQIEDLDKVVQGAKLMGGVPKLPGGLKMPGF
mmetsp:Transcript_100404/g.193810  ORF Transcript_100404/g.193810 Transcript_100404/m.193810 type:complete len:326 (-) Transcript_100404:436-1413(-)|eukprot:CAMPEP_0172764102 /NCGR_PEP_ID=MMETSP1074-20121228/176626_1 /TAXON_ID=2916 /ORGANISM="Ceratium fusus, Strain PA161109" /LENGTH=325 /DNA_ID=CAMNT_0013598805 /DNA_START=46 /DNA_END=1023 /DNA_ORIENTATION=+